SFVMLGEVGGALDPNIGFPTQGLPGGPEFPLGEPPLGSRSGDDGVDGLPTGGNADAAVDEDGLPFGLPGGIGDRPGEEVEVSGVLGYSFGPDGVGSFAWSSAGLTDLGITSGGDALTYVVSPNGLTLTAFAGDNP